MRRHLTIFLLGICLIGLVFFSGCKAEEEIVYDIRGLWTLNFFTSAVDATPPSIATITFTGSLTSGTFIDSHDSSGTYTVNGQAVQWIYPNETTYTGNFTSPTDMNGTWRMADGYTGPWDATKM